MRIGDNGKNSEDGGRIGTPPAVTPFDNINSFSSRIMQIAQELRRNGVARQRLQKLFQLPLFYQR
jgi:hypothetical protein